jgi:hypothetical protein
VQVIHVPKGKRGSKKIHKYIYVQMNKVLDASINWFDKFYALMKDPKFRDKEAIKTMQRESWLRVVVVIASA